MSSIESSKCDRFEFFTQSIFLNLAHRIARQFINKRDMFGLFESRELIFQSVTNGIFRERGAFFRHNDRDHCFTKIRIVLAP